MTNNTIPYLCGGTFLAQILRARNQLATSTEHTMGQKESLSEQETFRQLISIYRLSDFIAVGDTLKIYTNKFKTCRDSLVKYLQFTDSDMRYLFSKDVQSNNSTALRMTSKFVKDYIDINNKGVQLVRCLLDIIENDSEISEDDEFFISSMSVKKKDLLNIEYFYLDAFLLGVWHYIIIHRAENNEYGAATYNSWYPNKNIYKGTVGSGIMHDITVNLMDIPVFENKPSGTEYHQDAQAESKEADTKVLNQYIDNATIVNQYGKENIHIDHVEVLNL